MAPSVLDLFTHFASVATFGQRQRHSNVSPESETKALPPTPVLPRLQTPGRRGLSLLGL